MPGFLQVSPPWEWTFAYPWALLLALPALLILPAFAAARALRAARLRRIAAEPLLPRLAPPSHRRDAVQAVLAALGLALCAVALARPQNDMETERRTVGVGNLAIVLDVSRSMLAEDLRPSRLERAKTDIADFTEAAGEDRLGLVVFRGAPSVVCPLTSDRRFFAETLNGVDSDSAPRGETDLPAAIGAALEMLGARDGSGTARGAIVVFSDGGDFSASQAGRTNSLEQTAERARKLGVPVFTVGLGSAEGGEVPMADGSGPVKGADGKPVLVKLEGEILERTARLSGGRYFPVGTGVATPQTWRGVYDAIDSRLQRREMERLESRRRDIYAICLLPALLLLLAAACLSRGRFASRRGRIAAVAGALASAFAFAPGTARAAVPPDVWNAAITAYRNGEWDAVRSILADVRSEPVADVLRAAAYLANTNSAAAEETSPAARASRLSAAAAAYRAAALEESSPAGRATAADGFRIASAPLPELRHDAYLTNLYATADAAKKEKEKDAQPRPPQSENEMFAKLEYTERIQRMMDAACEIIATNGEAAASEFARDRLEGSIAASEAVRTNIYDGILLLERDLASAPPVYSNLVAVCKLLGERVKPAGKAALSTMDALADYAPEANDSLSELELSLHALWTDSLFPPELIREGAKAQTNRLENAPMRHDRDWQNESAYLSSRFEDTFPLWASNNMAQAQAEGREADVSATNVEEILKLLKDLRQIQEKLVENYSEADAKKSTELYEKIAEKMRRPPPPSQQQQQQQQQNNQDQKQNQDQNQNQNQNQEQNQNQDQDKNKDGKNDQNDKKQQEQQAKKDKAKEDKTSDKVKNLMRRVEERENEFEKEKKNILRANTPPVDPGKDL